MTQGIKDKIVVVTGASSGLGEATARLLSAQGATVVLGAARGPSASAGEDLESRAGKALTLTTDVRLREQVKALVDSAVQTYGHIDVMINNRSYASGAARTAEGRRMGPDDRRQHQGRAVRHRRGAAAHAAAEGRSLHQRLLRRRPQGSAPASPSTRQPNTRSGSCLNGLRQEVKPYNIRTTVISPGAVATELPNSVTDPDASKRIRTFYEQVAVPTDSFARAVAFAMSQPEDVDINKILFRPTRQEL